MLLSTAQGNTVTSLSDVIPAIFKPESRQNHAEV
jgi:hypothetical protein